MPDVLGHCSGETCSVPVRDYTLVCLYLSVLLASDNTNVISIFICYFYSIVSWWRDLHPLLPRSLRKPWSRIILIRLNLLILYLTVMILEVSSLGWRVSYASTTRTIKNRIICCDNISIVSICDCNYCNLQTEYGICLEKEWDLEPLTILPPKITNWTHWLTSH